MKEIRLDLNEMPDPSPKRIIRAANSSILLPEEGLYGKPFIYSYCSSCQAVWDKISTDQAHPPKFELILDALLPELKGLV